jgi:hypothetical protein
LREFVVSLSVGVGIPIVTAVAAAVWKLLAKITDYTANDYLLAFELLIAAVSVQLAFLGTDLIGVATPGGTATDDKLVRAMSIRIGLLVVVGLVALPAFALFVRYCAQHDQLTKALAIRVSLIACTILVTMFLANYFLYAIL